MDGTDWKDLTSESDWENVASDSGWEDATSASSYSGSDADERENTFSKAQQFLKEMRNMHFLDILGRGSFGDVTRLYDTRLNVQKAAKIVIEDNINELEKKLWPKLSHENLLLVEECLEMPERTIIFISPIKFKALDCIVSDKTFQENYGQNHKALKFWFKGILKGIEYLHAHGYCHLDLKTDNVLIGYDGQACVCDFTFINYNTSPLIIDDIGLPGIYKPPEAFTKRGRKSLDGVAVDLWAFGLLMFESLTGLFLLDNVDDYKSWAINLRPVLENVLEDDSFYHMVRSNFPNYAFTEMEIYNILEFIGLFLQVHSKNRISAERGLKHPFFSDVSGFAVKLIDIYPRKELYTIYFDEDGKEILGYVETDSPTETSELQHKQYQKRYVENWSKRKAFFKMNANMGFKKAKNRRRIPKRQQFQNRTRSDIFQHVTPCVSKQLGLQQLENVEREHKDFEEKIVSVTCLCSGDEEETSKATISSKSIVLTYLGDFCSQHDEQKILENSILYQTTDSSQSSVKTQQVEVENSEQKIVENIVTTQRDVAMIKTEPSRSYADPVENVEEGSIFFHG